jgi:hypothetical protein
MVHTILRVERKFCAETQKDGDEDGAGTVSFLVQLGLLY